MYTPAAFVETDAAEIARLIACNAFGLLVTVADGVPVATHLPLLLEGPAGPGGRLVGHMARANGQWRGFDGTAMTLCVFTGVHAYVSPRWYADPDNVPTWNYEAVHIYGRPRLIEAEASVRALIERLSANFEAGRSKPWSPGELGDDNVARRLKGIAAFEISIERVEGKRKLGQNKPPADRRAAAAVLAASADPTEKAVGRLMAALDEPSGS